MASQEVPVLIDDKKLLNEFQTLEKPVSLISNPGTSKESSNSPPSQLNEEINAINPMLVPYSSSDASDCEESHLLKNSSILPKNLSPENEVDMNDDSLLETKDVYELDNSCSTIPVCKFCKFTAKTRKEYDQHLLKHFQIQIAKYSCMTRIKRLLEMRMSDYRKTLEDLPRYSLENDRFNIENRNQNDEPRGCKKDTTKACKACDFVGKNKSEFYAHLRKKECFTGPLHECEFDQCEFCTRYKQHFQYHLFNHNGSKPFKCDQCAYECVNQSMLNSHTKSHSSQYPFRCKTCPYVSKYSHSFKLHLKKKSHEQDKVLNPGGTEIHNIKIDVNGRKRRPKSKNAKSSNPPINDGTSAVRPLSHPCPPSASYHQNSAFQSLNSSFAYNSSLLNCFAGSGFFQPPVFDPPISSGSQPFWNLGNLKCNYPGCDYSADSTENMKQDLVVHLNSRQCLYEKYARNSNVYFHERHLASEGIHEIESHFQRLTGSAQRKQEAENARSQAEKQFQSRLRESSEVTRTAVPFKFSENSVAECGVRRGFSPTSNNRDFAHFPFSGIHNEESSPAQKNIVENRENSSYLRFSSISLPLMEEARGSSRNGSSCECADDYSTPLDLTINTSIMNSKVTDSFSSTPKWIKTEPVRIQPHRTIKNRRKGKAFKSDQYVQYEELNCLSSKDFRF